MSTRKPWGMCSALSCIEARASSRGASGITCQHRCEIAEAPMNHADDDDDFELKIFEELWNCGTVELLIFFA